MAYNILTVKTFSVPTYLPVHHMGNQLIVIVYNYMLCVLARTGSRHGEISHVMEQPSSAAADDAAHTPAIKLRIKIGRDTVVGTKRSLNS